MTGIHSLCLVAGSGLLALLLLATYAGTLSGISATADGVIVAKTFKPAGTYTQVPVGIDRSMRMTTDIPIAESYVFEVRIEGLDQSVFVDLNAVASRSFEVGQRVRVTYKPRGIPFTSKKYVVLDMVPADRPR